MFNYYTYTYLGYRPTHLCAIIKRLLEHAAFLCFYSITICSECKMKQTLNATSEFDQTGG